MYYTGSADRPQYSTEALESNLLEWNSIASVFYNKALGAIR